MKTLFTAALLILVSSSAFAATYTCEAQTLTITGAGDSAVAVIEGTPFSSAKLVALPGEMLPGFTAMEGVVTSVIGGQSTMGILMFENTLLNGEAKGDIRTFTGEGFATTSCVLKQK